MDQSITLVTPAMHRKRGAKARVDGKGRDDHGMHPRALAVADWQAGWDEGAPCLQHAPAAGRGVEVRQGDGVAA